MRFRLPALTSRQLLILAHDLLATAAAVIASFFIRFEVDGVAERSWFLVFFVPAFVLYSGLVYAFFGLYKAKWRFTSVPDLYNIMRAATVLAVTLLALDYVLLAPNVYGTFFFGKIIIVLYWLLQIAFLAGPRVAYRHFRHTRTLQHARAGDSVPTLIVGRTADADVLLRAIESGTVTKIRPVGILSPSPADRAQAIRGISVLGDPDDIERIIADLGNRGTRVMRIVLTSTALAPEAKPETILMRARRLGLATSRLPSLDDGGEALRLKTVNVEDLLLRPERQDRLPPSGRLPEREIDHRHRRRRLDRRRNLRSHRDLWGLARAGDRELGAGAARRAGGARDQAVGGKDRRPPRRYPRPRPHLPPDGRLPARHRVPCCGAQARAAAGAGLGGGGQDQRVRLGQRRRCRRRRRRRRHGGDLDRQGDRAGLGARRLASASPRCIARRSTTTSRAAATGTSAPCA